MTNATSKKRVFITRSACFGVDGLWARLTSTGKVVGITYIPRGADKKTGLRTPKSMNVRANYQAYVVGGERAYDAEAKGLVIVADNNALIKGKKLVANGEAERVQCIRSFGKEGLLEVRAEGMVYAIVDCLKTKKCDCDTCLESQLPEAYDLANDR